MPKNWRVRYPDFLTYFGTPYTPAFLTFPFWQWPPLVSRSCRQFISDYQTDPWARA